MRFLTELFTELLTVECKETARLTLCSLVTNNNWRSRCTRRKPTLPRSSHFAQYRTIKPGLTRFCSRVIHNNTPLPKCRSGARQPILF